MPVITVYLAAFSHFRWQYIPAVASLCVSAYRVHDSPELFATTLADSNMAWRAVGGRLAALFLTALLSFLFQLPQPAEPDGPYGVGLDDEVFEDAGLQVHVKIFYPVSK